jgi:hypothetical protein
MKTIETEADGLMEILTRFMPAHQVDAMIEGLCGEEGDHFQQAILETVERIQMMPKTYETDGVGWEATVHLHYFGGSVDAWITEKDKGDPEEGDFRQTQAFGAITLTGRKENAELGYISIEELIGNGCELDLHWKPKPLKECIEG